MGAWVRVAEFTKAKHLKGGLVARSVAGLPFLLEEGLFCAFVPPVIDVPRQGTAVEVRPEARGGATVFFDTVVDANQADALVGCYVLARREDLPDDVLELQEGGIEGFTVVDAEAGAIGTAVATAAPTPTGETRHDPEAGAKGLFAKRKVASTAGICGGACRVR